MKTSGKQSGLEELHTIQVSVFQNETVKLSFRKVSLYRCQNCAGAELQELLY